MNRHKDRLIDDLGRTFTETGRVPRGDASSGPSDLTGKVSLSQVRTPSGPEETTMTPQPELTPIAVTVLVPRQQLRDLLSTAIEGGSNYWAQFSDSKREGPYGSGGDYLSVRVTEDEASGDEVITRVVTPEDLAVGIERLAACAANGGKYPEGTTAAKLQAERGGDYGSFPAAQKHLGDALGDYDAETADVVLQMTVFGELIYG